MTTIHDVAKRSGYSVSTVSRVLNQKKHVSKEARQAIESAIQALDYVPNDLARDLSQGKNFHIGIVLPHTKHPYFIEMLNGMIDCAFSTVYRLVLLPSEYDEKVEMEYLEQLRGKAFDALIFTSRGVDLDRLVDYATYGPIICSENPQRTDLQAVYLNRQEAYEEAFRWFQSKGKKDILLLLSRQYEASVTSQAVIKAYQAVFGQYPKESQIISGVTTYEEGFLLGERLARMASVEGIMANVDDVAAGITAAYQQAKCPPPVMVGQGNQWSSQLLHFSTIDHHLYDLGYRSLEMAIGACEQTQIELCSTFIARE